MSCIEKYIGFILTECCKINYNNFEKLTILRFVHQYIGNITLRSRRPIVDYFNVKVKSVSEGGVLNILLIILLTLFLFL